MDLLNNEQLDVYETFLILHVWIDIIIISNMQLHKIHVFYPVFINNKKEGTIKRVDVRLTCVKIFEKKQWKETMKETTTYPFWT